MPENKPRRIALLIATDTYSDAKFATLRAPRADAEALAAVLRDSSIGDYDVRVLHNTPSHEVNLAIEDVFATARLHDLIVVYVSGHGVKDEAGRLYFATTNSRRDRLGSTAVSAEFVRGLMDSSRSRHIVLLLDCCYAGAFPPGTRHRAGEQVNVHAHLRGRGCAVMTASSELEYAFETTGNAVRKLRGAQPSVFTGVLVEGLRTGAADLDADGLIDVDELYDYTYDKVRDATPHQTPRLTSSVEGKLVIANGIHQTLPAPEPAPKVAPPKPKPSKSVRNRKGLLMIGAIVTVVATITTASTVFFRNTKNPPATAMCDTSKGTLAVGVLAPLTGPVAAHGLSIQNATQLAVNEANERCRVKGYRLEVAAEDDQANLDIGKQAANNLAKNPKVIGVVGPLHSGIAGEAQRVLRDAGIALVSPANTDPVLTKGVEYPTKPQRQFNNYFRLCPTDEAEGAAAADFLIISGRVKFSLVFDGQEYSRALQVGFSNEVKRRGAHIVGEVFTIPQDLRDFPALVNKIKINLPDAVFYAGSTADHASELSAQLIRDGLLMPLAGGNILLSARGRQDDIAAVGGFPPDLPSAKNFAAAYRARGFTAEPGRYGAPAYDAANAIIESVAKAIENNTWNRADVISQLGNYQAEGATGPIKFDQYGDVVSKVVTVHRLVADKWTVAEVVRLTR